MIIIAFAMSASTVYAEDPAPAVDPTFIGGSKCKLCHRGERNGNIWETWLETKHAKSMESLVAKGEDKNPECLACHTTGYGTPSGYDAMADLQTAEALGSVSCEACHGAGSEYKSKKIMEDREAAIAAGMVIPNEATCTKCHNEKSPTFKGFNYEEALAKIIHYLPKATEGGTE